MLVKNVSFNEFLEEFKKYDRNDSFTYQGKKALFDYLEEFSEDLGEPIELDVIGLCCEFTEFENLEEFKNNYAYSIGDDIDDIDDIEDIQDYTIVIKIDDEAFIIQDF